jgi:outer membrane receptor protein involved in Fe transport
MIHGIEANINLPIGQKISWNTNDTYMSGNMNEWVNQFSKLALNFVKLQIVSSINVQWTKNLNTSLALRHIERINNDAYQIVDARINYQLKNTGIYLNFNNLGNVQYREIQTVPMMPRWVYLGFKFNI